MYQRQYSQAVLLFEESLAIYRTIGNFIFIAILLGRLARALLRQQEVARARTLLEESVATARKVGVNWGAAIELSMLGQVAVQQGEVERAEVLFAESIQLSQKMGDRRSMVRTRLFMASLAVQQRRDAYASAQYEESLAVAIELGLEGFITSSLKGLGCVLALQGQYNRAVLLWGAAENLPESSSTAIPQAIYERMRAAARSHLGEHRFARVLAEGRAMTPAQALAAHGMQLDLESKQPQVASPSATKLALAYPAGLTAREVEVLRLVAQGMTNSQIAEWLILSSHTVNAHVRSIYTKLELNSRSALTRYALEHHLL